MAPVLTASHMWGAGGPAIEELGFSLAGTILFAQYVVLAEGDADPVLMQAMFQKLVAWGKVNVDLRAFSVISTGSSKNTDALVRLLTEGSNAPNLLVVVDGDGGGKSRLKALAPLLETRDIGSCRLIENTTVEDYLPAAGEQYIEAVARYVNKIILDTPGNGEVAPIASALRGAAEKEGFCGNKVTTGVASWALARARELAELKSEPSKLGVAREYVDFVNSAEADVFTDSQLKRSRELLQEVQAKLSVPKLPTPDTRVMVD